MCPRMRDRFAGAAARSNTATIPFERFTEPSSHCFETAIASSLKLRSGPATAAVQALVRRPARSGCSPSTACQPSCFATGRNGILKVALIERFRVRRQNATEASCSRDGLRDHDGLGVGCEASGEPQRGGGSQLSSVGEGRRVAEQRDFLGDREVRGQVTCEAAFIGDAIVALASIIRLDPRGAMAHRLARTLRRPR